MRILLVTVKIPFISGGAEALADGLCNALRRSGHSVDILTMPFRFSPADDVLRAMRQWQNENLESLNGYALDRVICLKFPAFYCRHPRRVLWLLHQHRSVYDLWDHSPTPSPEEHELRRVIVTSDTDELSTIAKRFTISRNVADRLHRYNGLSAESLYHPPPRADFLYTAPPEQFIFCPSRLEALKRQDLLIRAMQHVRSPVVALVAGTGGQEESYRRLVEELDVGDRVRLIGNVDDHQMAAYYAMSLAVFFGPQDEDYGYVTLEAMLSAKPVITCRDSGGPLEFVRDGETGLIVDPDPRSIASAIETLAGNIPAAREMGRNGQRRYQGMRISWDGAVDRLLA